MPSVYSTENNALPRHIQRVSRAFSKVFSKVDDLDSVKDYLHILGKIHQRNGIENHEMLVMGPHFVASAVRYLPSTLRERRIQGTYVVPFSENWCTRKSSWFENAIPESWLRFFTVIMKLMSNPMELSPGLSSEERNLITNCSKQLLEIQQVLGPQKLNRKFQKVWSKEQGK